MLDKVLRVIPNSHIPTLHPVLLHDDASGLFTWEATGTGAGWTADYSNADALVGVNSIRMATRPVAPAPADNVILEKHLWLPATRLGRLQLAIKNAVVAATTAIMLRINWYDGTHYHAAALLLRFDLEQVYYFDAGFNPVILPGWRLRDDALTWHRADFSVDFLNNTWGRVSVDHHVTSLAGITLYEVGAVTVPHLELWFQIEIGAAVQGTCYMDQLLLTPENL